MTIVATSAPLEPKTWNPCSALTPTTAQMTSHASDQLAAVTAVQAAVAPSSAPLRRADRGARDQAGDRQVLELDPTGITAEQMGSYGSDEHYEFVLARLLAGLREQGR